VFVDVDSTGGAFQLNLPVAADCAAGDQVIIKDIGADAAANNITIGANSSTIDGAANFVMNVDGQALTLRKNTAGAWSIV
jgi:hypothetical protein